MKKFICFVIIICGLIYWGWHSQNLKLDNLSNVTQIEVVVDDSHQAFLKQQGKPVTDYVTITDKVMITEITDMLGSLRFKKSRRRGLYWNYYTLYCKDASGELIVRLDIDYSDEPELHLNRKSYHLRLTKGEIDLLMFEKILEECCNNFD